MFRVSVPVPMFRKRRNGDIRLVSVRNVKVFDCQEEEDAAIVVETLMRQGILTRTEQRVWKDVTVSDMKSNLQRNEGDIVRSLEATFGEEEY